eukprot:4845269-Amphidinium_carterae.1
MGWNNSERSNKVTNHLQRQGRWDVNNESNCKLMTRQLREARQDLQGSDINFVDASALSDPGGHELAGHWGLHIKTMRAMRGSGRSVRTLP